MRWAWLVCVVLVGCGPGDALPFPAAGLSAAPDPSTFGPFPVGVRTETYTDNSRKEPDGTARRLVTEIWYPATQATRGGPGVSYDILEYFTDEQRAQLTDAGVPLQRTVAVRDAPPAKAHGPFPLVIFSHGQAAVRTQSTYFTVLLASHGYVVVSPDHQGGTLADVVRGKLQNVAEGIETRPIDALSLITRFTHLKQSDPLFGLIDADHIGVAGHSFGALTALRVAALDSRVTAIVPQAPVSTDLSWITLPKVHLTIPVELQAAHDDRTLKWDEHVAPSWPELFPPRYLLDITHGGHFTFSDLCAFDLARLADQVKLDIPGADIRKVLTDGCGPTAPPASAAQPIIDNFAVGFFNLYLRGSEGSRAHLTQTRADAISGDVAVFTADP